MLWDWLEARRDEDIPRRKAHLRALAVMAVIGGYLLIIINCVTAVVCFVLGVALLFGPARLIKAQNGRKILIYCFLGVGALVALDKSIDISGMALKLLGRNPDLSSRTLLWDAALHEKFNSLHGVGFYAFWDTERGGNIWDELDFIHVKTVHNSYIETYLDGGMIGVALFAILIVATGRRAINRLFEGTMFGRIGFVVWVVALVYNNSESNFFRLGTFWFTFLLFTIDYPSLHNILRAKPVEEPQEAEVHAVQASFVSRPEMIQPHGP